MKTIEELKEFWDDYQEKAWRTCLPSCQNWEYLCAGLASEVGEVMDKIKKKIRGDYDDCPEKYIEGLKGEISDCAWYFYSMMTFKGIKISSKTLEDIQGAYREECDISHYRIVSDLLGYANTYCLNFGYFSSSGEMVFPELLYSLAHLATALGFTLEDAAEYNIQKLAKRYSEDKIMGAGDYR